MLRKSIWLLGFCLVGVGFLASGCSDDDSGGPVCGDGVLNEGEACDGDQLNGQTCLSQGFDSGSLGCAADCTFDTVGCTNDLDCGNGTIDSGEDCDSDDVGTATCQNEGFDGGTLACNNATCELDTSGCTNDLDCGNGTIDGDEDCDSDDIGTATCQGEGFDGGALACNNATCELDTSGCCNHTCSPAGDTQCDGSFDWVQTCQISAATGCREWTDTEDCSAGSNVCVEDAGSASCQPTCVSDCTILDDLRCNGDLVEVCSQNGTCLNWATQTLCVSPLVCYPLGGTPQCISQGSGDTCASPAYVTSLPFNATGTDITADFPLSTDFNPPLSGCGWAYGPEAIYLVPMRTGESIHIWETGGLDCVLRVLDVCDPANSVCLVSEDLATDESGGIYFTAQTDGDYFVILEAASANPNPLDYNFNIDLVGPEIDCGDSADNDGDGLTDCEDPDCFGLGSCTTETECDDGWDNDGDGDTDCADSECAGLPICTARQGVWEMFSASSESDVDGCTLTFTYVGPNYDYAYDCSGLSNFPVTPGGGTVATTTLNLGDSDFAEVALQGTWDFNFYGASYSSVFVGSNGFVTFGSGDTSYNTIALTFFELARIAVLDEDFDPTSGNAEIYVDENADHVAISYVNIEHRTSSDTNSFQLVLHQSGAIEMHYVSINYNRGTIGLSNGGLVGDAPVYVDFVPVVPSSPGDLFITEVMYDPAQVSDSEGEYIELYNPLSSTVGLQGCTIEDDSGLVHTFGTFNIPAQSYAVIAQSGNETLNGGIPGAYALGTTFLLDQAGDRLMIRCDGTTIVNLDFRPLFGGWPAGGSGVSMQLSTAAYDVDTATRAMWWCDSTATYGSGDTGTPGNPNSDCGMSLLLTEEFDTWPPSGWTIVDGGASTDTWVHCDPNGLLCVQLLGADGHYAGVNSDIAGSVDLDEGLISPSFDCTGLTTVQVGFYHYYNDYSATTDQATVEVSTDLGITWQVVQTYTSDTNNGQSELLDISNWAANQSNVRIRFRYVANYDYYWLLDSVVVIGTI